MAKRNEIVVRQSGPGSWVLVLVPSERKVQMALDANGKWVKVGPASEVY